MADDSYSYSGSYTGDYSYSYTYSDDSGSYTDSASEKSPPRTPTAAPAAPITQEKKAPSPSKSGATKRVESTDSYSYSYSYESLSSPHAPPVRTAGKQQPSEKAAPVGGNSESNQKQLTNTNGNVDDSYSYSYTDDDGDGSYSYSYSGSQTETAPPPALRVPKVEVTRAGQQSTTRVTGPVKRTAGTAPLAVTSPAAVLTNAKSTESYSYSYSYSDGEDGSYSYSGGSNYYSDGSYYYSDGSYYDEDSNHYSGTYSYTGDSSYYYSYSSAGSRDGRGRKGSRSAAMDSGSSDYYYGSSLSGDYTDNSDYYYSYYYHGSSYTGEESFYSYLYSYNYYSYSATSKSVTSTTSSYDYGSFTASLLSESRTAAQRELVVLRAPSMDVPRPPPAPKRCFVMLKSTEDAVWAFLQRLMALQQFYEMQRAAVSGYGAAAVSGMQRAGAVSHAAANEDREDMDTPFIPTKDGCFSERSMRIAFRVLRLNHLERQQALKNAPAPLPMEAMLDIFNTCVAARAKEKVAQAFLALDPYRCGEMSLTKLSVLLRWLGIGTSPVVEGHRISIGVSTENALEMVVNVERMVQPGAPAAAGDAQEYAKGAASATNAAAPASANSQQPMQWEVTPVYVLRIIRKSAANQRSTLIRWKNNTLYMGRHAIVRNVTTKTLFERLKTHIEAASYLCVIASVFSIEDAEKGTLMVQYPQFIRSVLLADPPAHRNVATATNAAPRKLLYIENLFHAVFHPLEVLQAYEAGLPVPRYNRDWAVESTLYSTNDTEEKRRRNVVPGISADMQLIPTLSPRPPDEVQLSFVLQKVRVPAQPPSHSRCFCLVSAVTPSRVFLPAIEVPVRRIVASTKKGSSFTWVFHDKKHKQKEAALQFAGTAVDSIYVECCYETYDVWPPESREAAAEAADGALGSTTPFSTTTVWCAGYAVFPVNNAKTVVLPVKAGSLLQEQPHDSAVRSSGVPARAEGTAAAMAPYGNNVNPSKHRNSCMPKVCRRDYTKNAAEKAYQVKVKILKSKKPIPGAARLPARYIAFQRHVPIISQLRAVVELVAQETSHAPQAFRQQAVRYIFSVAADSALLDQLCALWAYRERHWKAAERKDEQYKQRKLLACVAALYALNDSCARSRETFAKFLAKGKALRLTIDPSAPMVPVRV